MNRSEIRKIGGSTIAAILGLSQWSSPHSVYLELTGETPPTENNAILERGRKLEPVIAQMFAAIHDEFQVVTQGILEDDECPYLIGSPDRMLLSSLTRVIASGLEIKTADVSKMPEWGEEETDEVPVEYWTQCQWYMGLTGLPDWYIAVGFVKPGSKKIVGYREYYLEFDKARFAAMKQRAIEFWENHVVPKVPPPITVADAATVQYYKSRYPNHVPDKWAYSDEELDRVATEYLLASETLKQFEKNVETLKIKLIAAIGENEGIKTAVGNFTYRTTKPSEKTDWKAVAIAAGADAELIQAHTTEQAGVRRFLTPKTKS
jgi:putative phage-type endonuclease